MVIYIDIIILVGNYIVVNELKVHMNNNHFKVFFNVHVKEIIKEFASNNDYDMDYENMAHFSSFKSP
jgi:hypothetical protein